MKALAYSVSGEDLPPLFIDGHLLAVFSHGLSLVHAYREEANSLGSLLKRALIPS